MSSVTDIKILHAKNFREGSIKQATFLKSFKREILELASFDYKPSEIKGYLEDKFQVSINMNSFYSWLNYTKTESKKVQDRNNKRNTSTVGNSFLFEKKTEEHKSTVDVLTSTDFD